VSSQHRLLVEGPGPELHFGVPGVLVPALCFADGRHGRREVATGPVTYHHVLLKSHRVLRANGAAAESLWLGPGALEAITPEQEREIRAILPAVDAGTTPPGPCGLMLCAHEGRVALAALA